MGLNVERNRNGFDQRSVSFLPNSKHDLGLPIRFAEVQQIAHYHISTLSHYRIATLSYLANSKHDLGLPNRFAEVQQLAH